MKPINCGKCDYWVKPSDEDKVPEQQNPPGTCHLHPPKVDMVPTPRGPMALSLWPQVSGDAVGCSYGQEAQKEFDA